MSKFVRILASSLTVSEPNPAWFGNEPNPSPRPAHWTNDNWLKSRFHFRFAEDNKMPMGFPPQSAVIRVVNDDLVQPARGFGTHGHADMEIATIILNGALTHKDSMHNAETLRRGSVQFMSAASGVRHSEKNLDAKEPLRFLQCWILPRSRGGPPNYGQLERKSFPKKNEFEHVVGDAADDSCDVPVKINQDCNFHIAELEKGKSASITLKEGRAAYVIQAEGACTVKAGGKTTPLERHDGGHLFGPGEAAFTATDHEDGNALVVVIEVPNDK